MNTFGYLDTVDGIKVPQDSIVLIIDQVLEEQELFLFYNDKLQFPYFGFNWSAFRDCVTDGSWINEKNIIIIHSVMPSLDAEELYYYVFTLLEAVHSSDEIRTYYVYFPISCKNSIEHIMSKM